GQTVSVLAGNGATTASTVTTQPDGTVEISVTSQTAGTSVVTASINKRARVTDAFGNALAGQTVSVLADNGATVALTETTKPDGTAEISVTSQTAGVSAVTVSINNSSQSR
ncbi:Ig-like domain-containing protein, partial [Escherichia coli]|uniref:Ig-like domain-containing protein n=1 Tax=Escherichia coli TaxID=562 RepID=UPI001F4BAB2E